ncbi:MAG: ribosome hibernation-promoting factor, HPF/YfiA family [Candidatus Aminicenantes bacterium]
MNINYTARHAHITPDIKEYCEKRVKNLEKLLEDPLEVDFIFSVEKYRKKAEINIKSRRMALNAAEETPDLMSSLGLAFDNIEKRVKKERGKLRERKRKKRGEREVLVPSEQRKEQQKRVIRSEDYSLKPMPLEEALLQFDLDKRDVFVFRKVGSDKWAVIYRRKDGNYGLVEPE